MGSTMPSHRAAIDAEFWRCIAFESGEIEWDIIHSEMGLQRSVLRLGERYVAFTVRGVTSLCFQCDTA